MFINYICVIYIANYLQTSIIINIVIFSNIGYGGV